MKGRIFRNVVGLGFVLLFASCVSTPQPRQYPLEGLYVTMDANQMSGEAIDQTRLAVGESVTLYVRGMSSVSSGKVWFKLSSKVEVAWSVDEGLEVVPGKGHVVTVKLVKPINGAAKVDASTVLTSLVGVDRTANTVSIQFSTLSGKFKIESKQ